MGAVERARRLEPANVLTEIDFVKEQLARERQSVQEVRGQVVRLAACLVKFTPF